MTWIFPGARAPDPEPRSVRPHLAARGRPRRLAVPARRCGGPQRVPAALDPGIPVFPMGVGSNLIVRDGGIEGVVIRLGRGFNERAHRGRHGHRGGGGAGCAGGQTRGGGGAGPDLPADDPRFHRRRAEDERGLLRHLCRRSFRAPRRCCATGRSVTLDPKDITFSYRHTDLPEDAVITEVRFTAPRAIPRRWRRGWPSSWPSATRPSPRRTARRARPFAIPPGFPPRAATTTPMS
jgi:UDP-N-acetylmuramate dehydrogenase